MFEMFDNLVYSVIRDTSLLPNLHSVCPLSNETDVDTEEIYHC